jgi:hypothetical protein
MHTFQTGGNTYVKAHKPFFILAMLWAGIGLAQQSWGGAFDPLAVGARAWGMGNALTAAVDDASAVYWNPAALADVTRPQLTAAHMDLQTLGLLSYDFIAYAQPFLFGNSIGVSWIRLSTTERVNFLDYAENTFIVSYQQPVSDDFSTGINLKVFQVQYEQSGAGFGADLGLRYRLTPDMVVALVGENVSHPEIYWLTGAYDRLPVNLRLGIAGRIWRENLISLDWQHMLDNPQINAGVERWFFSNTFVLRLGGRYVINEKAVLSAVGFGLKIAFLELDYAYGGYYDQWDGNHVLGFKLAF